MSKEILELGNKSDFSITSKELGGMIIRKEKAKKVSTKRVLLYLEDLEFEDTINQPFIFIMLPFFSQKRQKKEKGETNIIYEIQNSGITFSSTVNPNKSFEGFTNSQPSGFERRIFDFILFKFQSIVEEIRNEIGFNNLSRKDLRENLKKVNLERRHISFHIKDVENYLEIKEHPNNYNKIEKALYNLQSTTYNFRIRNKRDAGSIIREVYKRPLNLIKYEKIKEKNEETGKYRITYKVNLDSRILEDLVTKLYLIFSKNRLNDMRKKDKAAERIYQFISMKRFASDYGEYRIETLSTIIPLALYRVIRRKSKSGELKEYNVKQTKRVLKRITLAFDNLVEMGYIKEYEAVEVPEEKSYKICYKFNIEKDNKCHISTYLKKNEKISNKLKKKKEIENELSEILLKELEKTKRNIYFSRKYNKRVYNKLKKIYNEQGEKITLNILKNIYKGLNTDIEKSLVQYINKVLSEVLEDKNENKIKLFPEKKEKIIEVEILEDNKEIIKEEEKNRKLDIFYNSLSKSQKNKADKMAEELLLQEDGMNQQFLKLLKKNQSLYSSMFKKYRRMALENF